MSIVITLIEREFKILFRSKLLMLLMIAQPVILIFLFVLSMGNVVGEITYRGITVSYVEFMVPSVVILTLMFVTMMVSQSVFNEKFSNMLIILLSTRMTARDYIVSKLITNTFISLTQAMLMLTAYLLIIGGTNIISIIYALPPIIIASLTLSGIYLSLLGYLKTISAFSSAVNILTLIMIYSAPLFYPLEAMPFPLNFASNVNPLTYIVESTRIGYLLKSFDVSIWISSIICIIFILLSIHTMKNMLTEV